jgi:hypothetical protein
VDLREPCRASQEAVYAFLIRELTLPRAYALTTLASFAVRASSAHLRSAAVRGKYEHLFYNPTQAVLSFTSAFGRIDVTSSSAFTRTRAVRNRVVDVPDRDLPAAAAVAPTLSRASQRVACALQMLFAVERREPLLA